MEEAKRENRVVLENQTIENQSKIVNRCSLFLNQIGKARREQSHLQARPILEVLMEEARQTKWNKRK